MNGSEAHPVKKFRFLEKVVFEIIEVNNQRESLK